MFPCYCSQYCAALNIILRKIISIDGILFESFCDGTKVSLQYTSVDYFKQYRYTILKKCYSIITFKEILCYHTLNVTDWCKSSLRYLQILLKVCIVLLITYFTYWVRTILTATIFSTYTNIHYVMYFPESTFKINCVYFV